MSATNKRFPAKTLLFGEHIVLENGEGLAIPNKSFSCQWQGFYDSDKELAIKTSRKVLKSFFSFLKTTTIAPLFNLDFYKNILEHPNHWLDSNIPIGYGLGSSGAFCAAIYDRCIKEETQDLGHLKMIFSTMESFFHGKSSGLDPLVSYLNDGIWLKSSSKIEQVSPIYTNKGNLTLFLLDTKQPRQASNIIARFQTSAKHDTFQKDCVLPLKEANKWAIKAFLACDAHSVWEAWQQISQQQRIFFDFAIPKHCLEVWDVGLRDGLYNLKLCGAGGGGFLLGATRDWEASVSLLRDFPLIPFWKV